MQWLQLKPLVCYTNLSTILKAEIKEVCNIYSEHNVWLLLAIIMLNKNTLGVKKCEANKKQPYLCATKIFDIS